MTAPIYVEQAALREALHVASLAVSRKGLPICRCALLQASEGILEVSATDLDQYLRSAIAASPGASWQCAVPLQPLMDLVDATPSVRIELAFRDEHLVIRPEGAGSARIATYEASVFPGMLEAPSSPSIEIPLADLAAVKRYVAHATSEDDPRLALNGILLRRVRRHLEAVATNGFRLGSITMAASRCDDVGPEDLIVHPKAIDLAYRLSAPESSVSVALHDLHDKSSTPASLEFRVTPPAPLQSIRLWSKLILATYPAWRQSIPRSYAWGATFDREELIRTARRVRAAARHEGDAVVYCDWLGDRVRLWARSISRGSEGSDSLPARTTGDPIDIAWSANQLLDILAVFEGSEISVSGNGPQSATIWRDVGDAEGRPLVLLMPIKRTAA